MDNSDEVIITAAAFTVLCSGYKLIKEKKPRKRRCWMVLLNKSRKRYNDMDLLVDLLKEPPGKLENFCRMSFADFSFLLSKIEPFIAKKDTKWRKAIPANERLAITLRFLATGDSFKSLHYLFKVSPQLISAIIPEVCNAVIKVLKECIKLPATEYEWKSVAQKYNELWNFPHCIGAMDGKHVAIQAPINSGSEFYNYKHFFSVVLMALVDAEYCFMFADCGCQGRLSDGAVYQNTELYRKIINNELHFPPPEPLPGREKPMPYVIVGDDAFPLSNQIIKPFPGQHGKGSKSRIFNYRFSRARRVSEYTFGIMASVFRVLRKPMLLNPDKAALVVMTCVLLHNFLRRSKTSRLLYSPPGTFDSEEDENIVEGSWQQDNNDMSSLLPMRRIPRKPTIDAKQIRDEFAEYLVDNGNVPWQYNY